MAAVVIDSELDCPMATTTIPSTSAESITNLGTCPSHSTVAIALPYEIRLSLKVET